MYTYVYIFIYIQVYLYIHTHAHTHTHSFTHSVQYLHIHNHTGNICTRTIIHLYILAHSTDLLPMCADPHICDPLGSLTGTVRPIELHRAALCE